jgi:predicted nucleic acid-binding protein
VIVDASVVVAAILGQPGVDGWARALLGQAGLAAPHLMPAEVCQRLRRHAAGESAAAEVVAQVAMVDLLGLTVELHPFAPFAERVWELRKTVSAYDAWYVALAEALDVPFATLDGRLARASGPRCAFEVPDVGGVA